MNEIEQRIENLMVRLISGVIAHNGDLRLERTFSGASLSQYKVHCHGRDIGQVLGKAGARFRSFRLIMELAGKQAGREMQLVSVVKPDKREDSPSPKFRFNPSWPRNEIKTLLADTAREVLAHPATVEIKDNGDSAILLLRLAKAEHETMVELLSSVLNTIFQGIGMTHGIKLSVDVGRS